MKEEIFEESTIPRFVWDFVKKHTTSIMVAGILAMIIWSYLKKREKESYMEVLDRLLEKINHVSTDAKGAHYFWRVGANEEWIILVKKGNVDGYKILDGGRHLLSPSDKNLARKTLEKQGDL